MCVKKREELIIQRKRALKSQFDVAVELGISQASYSLIENGYRTPAPDDAQKLIQMFDLPDDYFGSKTEGDQEG